MTKSTNENKKVKKFTVHQKNQRYYQMLRVILDSYIQTQTNGGIQNVLLCLSDFQKTVNIKVPCAMIIGDMQGGDKHCGSSVNYSSTLAHLCRQCNISGDQSGNPNAKCKRMSMTIIKQMVINNDYEKLDQICQYHSYIAWFDVDFGGCQYGIFSAAMPVEALHSVEGGIILDVLKILFNNDLKPKYRAQLDAIAIKMTKWDKQFYMHAGTNPDMPRTIFKDGITKLTKLTHTYIVGIMLTVIILSLTDDGQQVFLHAFKTNGYQNPQKRLTDMRYIFQMLLAYWSWLKKDAYWKLGDTRRKNKQKKLSEK